MGAEQSSSRGTAASTSPRKKTDYYELLCVDKQASDEEIKKAYRKRALELHPDRNYGDVERATEKFAEVQAAYEVLSDAQERAWYDSHREAILRGDDPTDTDATPEFHNIRVTTADEIFSLIGRFSKSVPLDDSPNSFFTVLRGTFGRLAAAEEAAADLEGLSSATYPSFGTSLEDDKTTRAFYSAWSNFSTVLNFSWRDKWRLSDAPDRRVRRLMEKDNKKLREDAIREFNDAVRSLVVFVRKRDPRYVPNTQSEAERQKVLRESAAAQAARSRAANQAKMNDPFAIPEWVRPQGDEQHIGGFSESEGESVVEEIECVVCDKSFKSERQYDSHAKSKKHLKAVQQLQRRMKKENVNLDLHTQLSAIVASNDTPLTEEDNEVLSERPVLETFGEETVETTRLEIPAATSPGQEIQAGGAVGGETSVADDSIEDEEEDNDDYAPREAVEARISSQGDVGSLANDMAGASLDNPTPVTKIGKAKAKREKKAARQATLDQQGTAMTCAVCNEAFQSKTKLFKHIKESGHAVPQSQANTKYPPKKGGKR